MSRIFSISAVLGTEHCRGQTVGFIQNKSKQICWYIRVSNEIFDAVIGANLTIMMVLTSLHISAYNSLPTDYLKNINVWLIFNLVFTFVTTLLQVYIHNQKAQIEKGLSKVSPINEDAKGWNLSSETKMRAAQLVGKFVNPVIGLLFVIAYWAQGLLFLRV